MTRIALAAVSCWLGAAVARAEAPILSAPERPAQVAQSSKQAKAASQSEPPATKTQAVKPAPSSRPSAGARECFQKAQKAYVAGDLASALAGFLCAYQAAPSPELHFNLARVYERMGETVEGIARYQAYLAESSVTPRERKSIEARIKALRELRERQRAQVDVAKPSAEALSAEARVFYDRGVKLYRAQEYQGARAAFSAALQMSKAPELHFNLAVVSERLNRPQEAVDHYRAYLAARSNASDREQVEARIAVLQMQAP